MAFGDHNHRHLALLRFLIHPSHAVEFIGVFLCIQRYARHRARSLSRILIADDHAIFAEALSTYLSKTFTVIGVVADGRAMVQEAIRLRPDVVVADVSMPS